MQNGFFVLAGTLGIFGNRSFDRAPDGRFFITSEVNALRIGDANIAVTPNELDPQIGDRYRARMTNADHRFVAGLGNDEIGYQMPAEKFNPTCQQCWTLVVSGNDGRLSARGDARLRHGVLQQHRGPGGRAVPVHR